MPPTYSSAKLWTQVMTYPWKVLGLNMLPNLTLNWTEHWTWTISITIRCSICVDRTQLLRHLADLRIRYPVCNVNCKTVKHSGSVTERIRQSQVSQSVSPKLSTKPSVQTSLKRSSRPIEPSEILTVYPSWQKWYQWYRRCCTCRCFASLDQAQVSV